MKQKIVIKVHVTSDKCRRKALGIAATANGVQSMGIEGEYKDQLVVIGDGVDAINLTSCLRRKVGGAEIVTVEAVGGAEEKTKPAAEAEAAAIDVTEWPQPQLWYPADYHYYYYYYYSRPPVVSPYAVHCYDDGFHSHADSWCTIM